MKIVITGASGFVGRTLIPALAEAGAQLLLAGRDRDALAQLYPQHAVCSYATLTDAAKGFDLLVHLAVSNSDSGAGLAEYRAVNVQFTCEVVQMAQRSGIARFVHVSSSHALDASNQSGYAISKREVAKLLRSVTGPKIFNVYLPLVYGREWSGSLAWLNRLPRYPAKLLFRAMAAFKPTVHILRVADFLLNMPQSPDEIEIILSDPQRNNPWFYVSKRLIDLGFALSVIILLWWLFALLWISIRIQSPGPGIFAQTRIGQSSVEFTCYKFRTMRSGTVETGTHEVSENAVTTLGRFLRRTKLDELPQVINIVRNEVSLIGPRPCLPIQVELIEARRRCGVLDIKPGISGLSQINGIDMSNPQRLAAWDHRYASLQSLLLDIRIVVATLSGKGQGDRVEKVEKPS